MVTEGEPKAETVAVVEPAVEEQPQIHTLLHGINV